MAVAKAVVDNGFGANIDGNKQGDNVTAFPYWRARRIVSTPGVSAIIQMVAASTLVASATKAGSIVGSAEFAIIKGIGDIAIDNFAMAGITQRGYQLIYYNLFQNTTAFNRSFRDNEIVASDGETIYVLVSAVSDGTVPAGTVLDTTAILTVVGRYSQPTVARTIR